MSAKFPKGGGGEQDLFSSKSTVKNEKNVKFVHRCKTLKIIEIDHTQISHFPKETFGTNFSHNVKFEKCEICGLTVLYRLINVRLACIRLGF